MNFEQMINRKCKGGKGGGRGLLGCNKLNEGAMVETKKKGRGKV